MPKKKHVCRIGYISEDGISDFFWEDTPIFEIAGTDLGTAIQKSIYDIVMPFKYCPDCGKKQKGLK